MSPSFSVILSKDAREDFYRLPFLVQKDVSDEMRKYLETRPHEVLKSRIKKLHHLKTALYRLRVGDYRVYYRIKFREVIVLAILNKKDSERWLRQFG